MYLISTRNCVVVTIRYGGHGTQLRLALLDGYSVPQCNEQWTADGSSQSPSLVVGASLLSMKCCTPFKETGLACGWSNILIILILHAYRMLLALAFSLYMQYNQHPLYSLVCNLRF